MGQIVYDEDHVKKLGWKDTTVPARTGIIIYIKSALLRNEKELRADVRQYGIENSAFPQQSTVNQWFDEAQFESYRQLGRHSGLKAFEKVITDQRKAKREELRNKQATGLSSREQTLLDLLDAEGKLFEAIDRNNEPLSPNLIKTLFDGTKRNRR